MDINERKNGFNEFRPAIQIKTDVHNVNIETGQPSAISSVKILMALCFYRKLIFVFDIDV